MSHSNTPITRALISVSDKTDLVNFAAALDEMGIEIISTGGTSKAISESGIAVRDVSDITGFPEIMDGRVKTLHPKIHGGLLSVRSNSQHLQAQEEHDIGNIDLLVVNLYPFEETLARGASTEECIENIDIGGPAMIRAAAKNHQDVTVIVDVSDYERVIEEIKSQNGKTSLRLRQELAAKAYARTSAYDAAISNWFADDLGIETPQYRTIGGTLKQGLRYGENPHQSAAFYITDTQRPGVATATQIQGKELSYNNINDTDAAFECVAEFGNDTPAIAIIKHANPCGVAVGDTLAEAYKKALRCDPVSAFGGIIASNQKIDIEVARLIADIFTEVIIAPDADEEAKALFAKKKNLRLLLTGGLPDPTSIGLSAKTVSSGLLVQTRDNGSIDNIDLETVTKRAPTEQELQDLKFAFRVCKHVKSNTIIYAKDSATVGIGAGQMSRLDSSRIAARKSADAAEAEGLTEPLAVGSVVASDAFFPFADGLISAAEAGASAIIQPGGSIRDAEVIAAADERNLAMVFTGMRHFKH